MLLWVVGKVQASCICLQATGYTDFNRHTHKLAAAFYNHHSAIIVGSYSLAQFFAVLHDFDINVFSWKQHGFDSVSQFVDIQYFDALQFSHAIEIKVIGDDGAMQCSCHFHKLAIDFYDALNIGVRDLERHSGILLQAVSISNPRLPRFRRIVSAESAICCNSFNTKRGTTNVPLIKPVLLMSAMRPSMMALVSSSICVTGCDGDVFSFSRSLLRSSSRSRSRARLGRKPVWKRCAISFLR